LPGVGDVADRDPSLFVDEDVTVEELLARKGFQRHRRAIVGAGTGRSD
jgi:hypothetical protein